MKPTIILVTGAPGSGKTTFATALSEKLDIPVFYRDRITEVLWETPCPASEKVPNQFGPASAEIIFHIAEQLMKSNSSFIVESYWHFNLANERLRILKETYDYNAITFRLHGKPEVLYNRFYAREQTTERHDSLKGTKQKTLNEFSTAIELTGCNRMDIGGRIIDIDTSDFSKVSIDRLPDEVKHLIDMA